VKCANCYHDNPYFMTVCMKCNAPADPILVCPAGHVLAADQVQCTRCTLSWPEVTAFDGPPVLRGLLLAVEGRLVHDGRQVGLLELRDAELPVGLGEGRSPRDARVSLGSDEAIEVRLLVRPEGVQVCSRTEAERRGQTQLAYERADAGTLVSVGSARLRLYLFDAPRTVVASSDGFTT